MKRSIALLLLVIIGIFSSTTASFAQRITTRLTENDYDEENIRISNSGHIVWIGWSDHATEDAEIFLHDGTDLIWNTDNSWEDASPSLNGNGHVVWVGTDYEVFIYDGATETQITDNSTQEEFPRMNNNGDIVWHAHDGGDTEIYYYDSSAESINGITDNSFSDVSPKINDNGYISWAGGSLGLDAWIFLHDGASVVWQSEAYDNDTLYPPQLNNNNHLTWKAGACPDYCEIYLYDGSTTRVSPPAITSSNGYPHINNDDDIVWSCDFSETGGIEIVLYDADSDAIVWNTDSTINPGWDRYPDINDSGHVVWQGNDGNDYEIYLYDGSTVTQLTDNCYDDERPKINNDGHVVWLNYAESDSEVYLSRPVTGPAEEWAVTFGGINDDRATSVHQTADGGYIVSGDTASFGAGGIDFWVMRLDSAGNVIWEKSYGGAGSDYGAIVQQLDGGGYIVCGRTESFGAGGGDIWVLTLDENGDVLTERTFGGSEADSVASIDEISCDLGYVMAGRTESFGAGVKGDAWVQWIDSTGTVRWWRQLGTVGGGEGVACIRQTGAGGYIVAGQTYSFGAGNGDFWVFRLFESGHMMWEKTYGGSDIDRANDIQPTPGGGSIVVGDSYSFRVSGGDGYDAWVLKLDSLGAIEWQKAYGTAAWDYVNSVDVTSDGGYILAGTTGPAGAGAARDAWVMKLDADGNIVSQHTYGGPDWSSNDSLVSIDRALDGGFIVAGKTEFLGLGGGDLWLLKLNENGEIEGCSAMETWTATSIDTSVVAADTSATAETISAATSDTTATVVNTTAMQGNGCEPVPADLIDLPLTGQTASYYAGDDGAMQMGAPWPSPRFADNGDGTVTDNLTGLMWLKDANCANTIGHDPEATGDGSMYWSSGLGFVAGINDGTHDISTCSSYTATHTDWRMSNIVEIESLTSSRESDQAVWLNGQDFANVQSSQVFGYWASNTPPGNLLNARTLNMYYNRTGRLLKESSYEYVWPVRAGQQDYPDADYPANVWKTGQTTSHYPGDDGDLQTGVLWPVPRLMDNGDGTVSDSLTGLMWLKDVDCLGVLSWEVSFDTIANFSLSPGGYGCQDYTATYADWRMPNRKELFSLIDQYQERPALPSGHPFANVDRQYCWSSTTVASATSNAWYVDIYWGSMHAGSKSPPYASYILPVRGGTSADVPIISLHPATLSNSCTQGTDAAAQGLAVWNSGADTLSYSISDDAEWLSCSPSTGTSTGEADSITVTYLTSYLLPGTYSATITISDPGASNSPRYAPVELTVTPAPEISFFPTSFSNSCAQGTDALPQGLAVWNSGDGTLSYSISDNAGWLSCSPSSGTSTGEADSITLSYSTSALTAGTYFATVTVSDPSASNDPQNVPVELTVISSELGRINLGAPANESTLLSPPTFSWGADGGTNNVFAIDFSLSYPITGYWSTYENMGLLISDYNWTPSGALWGRIPSGSLVYWRVRGANRDHTPLTIIYSDEVWWFYKP